MNKQNELVADFVVMYTDMIKPRVQKTREGLKELTRAKGALNTYKELDNYYQEALLHFIESPERLEVECETIEERNTLWKKKLRNKARKLQQKQDYKDWGLTSKGVIGKYGKTAHINNFVDKAGHNLIEDKVDENGEIYAG